MRRITKACVLAIGLAVADPAVAETLTSEIDTVACPDKAALMTIAVLLNIDDAAGAGSIFGKYGCFVIPAGTRISGPLAISELYMRVRIVKTRQTVWVRRADVDP